MKPSPSMFPLVCAALLAVVAAPAAEPARDRAVDVREMSRKVLEVLDHSHWIADGRDDAPRKIYVFTDANCPFCTKFWSDARPWVDSGKVQLRHVLVAVIAPSSVGKAGTILTDADPARRLARFEQARSFSVARAMAQGRPAPLDDPGLPALQAVPPDVVQLLREHEQMMQDLRIGGTPGIVLGEPDGRLVIKSGLAPQDVGQVLGPL